MVLADEFRDGNVPAAFAAKPFLQRAFSALPPSVTERRLRADSAFYDEAALTWASEALPATMQTTRPKGLRFHLFNIAGEIVKTCRQLLLRMAVSAMELARICMARRAIGRMSAPSS